MNKLKMIFNLHTEDRSVISSNLSVTVFIMKRVAKVGNEEEPKMAMNHFGHVRIILKSHKIKFSYLMCKE
ncbi:hypothetical protein ACE6H2_007694 [Prunus campanulata]